MVGQILALPITNPVPNAKVNPRACIRATITLAKVVVFAQSLSEPRGQ
jgi:hypothetical protein